MKNLFCIIFCILLSGCGKQEATTDTWDNQVVKITKEDVKCGCSRGAVYAVNSSNNRMKAEITAFNETESTSTNLKVSINAKSKKYLGCQYRGSRNNGTGTNLCGNYIRYTLTSSKQAKLFNLESMQVASSAQFVPTGVKLQDNQCMRECANPAHPDNEGNCLLFQTSALSKADKVSNTVTYIASKIGTAVDKGDILSKFDIKEDECNRSDLFLGSGKLSNTGTACLASSSLVLSDNLEVKMNLHIPTKLEGVISKDTNTSKITFQDLNSSGRISFPGDELRNSDFGGHITKMEINNTYFVVSTENGCIGLKTNSISVP